MLLISHRINSHSVFSMASTIWPQIPLVIHPSNILVQPLYLSSGCSPTWHTYISFSAALIPLHFHDVWDVPHLPQNLAWTLRPPWGETGLFSCCFMCVSPWNFICSSCLGSGRCSIQSVCIEWICCLLWCSERNFPCLALRWKTFFFKWFSWKKKNQRNNPWNSHCFI